MFDPDQSVFIIAEVGVNHNGDPDLAMELVNIAREVGADAVKFQTFDASALVTSRTQKARYQQAVTGNTESQQQMLAKLQLDMEAHYNLMQRAGELDLLFMSTAFDSQSLRFLVDELTLPVLKIPSGEITNGPLLLEYAKACRNVVLSTGMSTLAEVQTALSVLAFGLTGGKLPSIDAFNKAFGSDEGQVALKRYVTLLHCTTQYPAPYDSVNLNALRRMQSAFSLRIGYSDHTPGVTVACAAVALGARVIEKHITLDKTLPGPDQAASLEPQEFQEMVEGIRIVEQSLGDGNKVPHEAELENLPVARKSLIAAKKINKGELFSSENVVAKRPGAGRSPMEYWSLLGVAATRKYEPDETIS